MSRARCIVLVLSGGLTAGMSPNGCPNSGAPVIPGLTPRGKPAVTAQANADTPRLVTLTADLSQYPDARTVNWDFGDGSTATHLPTPAGGAVVHTFLNGGTFTVHFYVFDIQNHQIATATMDVTVNTPVVTPPPPPPPPPPVRVKLQTNHGDIVVETNPDAAPKTVANFLRYVDEGHYNNIIFHRVVPGFVIQGGAFRGLGEGADPRIEEVADRHDAIISEANNGLSNVRGTLSMALRGQDANSATDQFFINLVDNKGLDTGPPPFTVFAHVVEGLGVMDEIGTVETTSVNARGAAGEVQPFNDVPVHDVAILMATRQ